jgi:glucose-6-phosphate 1-epimerase
MKDAARIAELSKRHGIAGVARVEAGNGGLPRILIESRLCRAEVYLYGAQVTSWIPAGGDEVIFVSEQSHWQSGKPIRGGIPVCFPWFRGKPDDPQAPTHGFVRTREWRLEQIRREADDRVSVLMSVESDEESRRWWPHEFRLEYLISVGERLDLELTMHNRGGSELHFQEALHTYFRVGDITKTQVAGLNGVCFLDNRDENREKSQEGDLAFSKQTDRAYVDATGAVDIVDAALHRRLVTEKSGSMSTIVWNPWSDGAAKLPDFGDDEWRGMLCVEAGNVLDQAVPLQGGASHTMRVSLRREDWEPSNRG